MAARTLSNLGLKAFFALGEDGWNDEVDTNFLKLSVLVQAGALDLVTVKPTSPSEGDVYVIDSTATSNANTIAVYDNGAWVHFPARNGWAVYNQADDAYVQFVGSTWKTLSLPTLRALSALPNTLGALIQTSAGFDVAALGTTAAGNILRRQDGDARYATVDHTHPLTGVTSFNTRTGAVSLTAVDVNAALMRDANQAANADGLSSFASDAAGLIEKTGAGAFTTRAVGVSSTDSIPTRAQADARYAAFSTTLLGLATTLLPNSTGLIQQIAPNTFSYRQIGGTLGTDILTRGAADAIYQDNSTVLEALAGLTLDGFGGASLRVNASETGFELAGSINVQTGTSHALILSDDYVECTNAGPFTLTVPANASVAFPIGAVVTIEQGGAGAVTLVPDAGVTINVAATHTLVSNGQYAVLQIKKKSADVWIAFGNLVAA